MSLDQISSQSIFRILNQQLTYKIPRNRVYILRKSKKPSQNLLRYLIKIITSKRWVSYLFLTTQQFIYQYAYSSPVCCIRVSCLIDNFRCHILRRATNSKSSIRAHNFTKSKIDQFKKSILVNHYIFRFHISINHFSLV